MISVYGLGEVQPYQQIKKYSCGAAAFKAVAQHWGETLDEPMLIRLIGIDPDNGSSAQQVAAAAKKLGYDAAPRYFESIDELHAYTANDIPVILAIQSFTQPTRGHFVVATEVDDKVVRVMDPNVGGNRRTLSRAELDRRWRFRDRVGIVITPRRRRRSLGAVGPSPDWSPVAIVAAAAIATTITVVAAAILVRRWVRRR